MKKLISLLLVAVLLSAMLIVPVSADDDFQAPAEITNLALNKEYTVSGAGDYVESYVGNLTDGTVGKDLKHDNNQEIWYALYHNGSRPNNAPDKLGYFIIDLEDVYSLTSFRINFINNTGWGVVPAEYAKAYVSLDGNAFEEIGEFEISTEEGVAYWTEIEANVTAKYVKIEVKLGGTFAFLSEIEVYGGKPAENDESTGEVEADMKEALGTAPADAKLDYVIDAPEFYKAGEEVTVTVSVKNITAENGIHVVEFWLYYDNEKLLLTNDLDEDDNNALVCFEELPSRWENFSRVNNDDGANSEDGTVLPLNDGKIICSVLTDNPNAKYAVKEDDVLVFTFTFVALEDAEGDLGFVIPHEEAEAAFNTNMGAEKYAANGGYAVVAQKVSTEDKMKKALGAAFDDAKLDFVIDAPETYQAGDDITVTVSVKNITAENGIHVIEFHLYYDNTKLLLTNDIDEDDNNGLVCFDELPSRWENFSRVKNDGGANSEDGTVLPLNDGKIICAALTDNPNVKYAVKEDDVLVFTFNFKVLDDAKGELGFVIPHAETEGAFNADMGSDVYRANGDYAITHEAILVKGYDPDCENTGLTDGIYCSECDTMIVEQETIDALGHKDGEWNTTLDPNCTEKGSKDLHCAVCDKVIKTEAIDALGHDYKSTVTDPTCTEQGYTTHVCHCGDTYVDTYVDALGHKDGKWVTTLEPTCTEKGSKDLHCAVCDAVIKTEEIAALGHKDGEWNTTLEPTCTEKGSKDLHCAVCDAVIKTEAIDALGHKDGEWNTTLEPTCTEKGSKDLHCAVCDAVIKTEAIDALGHDHKPTVTDPTCTEKGYTTHVCHCGDTYVDTYVDALGHDYEWVTTLEPTLDTEGEEEHRCTRCGDVSETKAIPALRLLGDINGNGEIDKYDYIMVKRNVMETLTLEDVQKNASDINGNGAVDKYDYILIKRHVMGTFEIKGTAKR